MLAIFTPHKAPTNYEFFDLPCGTTEKAATKMAREYGRAFYQHDKDHDPNTNPDPCDCFSRERCAYLAHFNPDCATPAVVQKITGRVRLYDADFIPSVRRAASKEWDDRLARTQERQKRKAAENAEIAAVRKKYAAAEFAEFAEFDASNSHASNSHASNSNGQPDP